MRPKSMILILIALGCGLVASIGISQVMEGRKGTEAKMEMVPILVAKREIKVSETIKPDMVAMEEWPKSKVPVGAITDVEEVKGRKPRQHIFTDEPIVQPKLRGAGEMTMDAVERIRPGFRAVTVKVTEDVAVGNLLNPGDTVDVLVYLRRGADIPVTTMKTLLENVRVFAVNEQLDRFMDADGKTIKAKTVTLEVEPNQVELLTLADAVGRIRLSARRRDDASVRQTKGAFPQELLGTASSSEGMSGELPPWLQNVAQDAPVEIEPQGSLVRSGYMDIIDPSGMVRYEFSDDGMPPRAVLGGGSANNADDWSSVTTNLAGGEGEAGGAEDEGQPSDADLSK